MSKNPIVIVDSDALIAQATPADVHHQKAMMTSMLLAEKKTQIFYPVTAIAETTAYVQRVLNSTVVAYQMLEYMTSPSINILEVNQQTLTDAFEFFSPKTSKKNTLFDCIVAALAKKHNAEAIFSFDSFYKKQGFKLASDLSKT